MRNGGAEYLDVVRDGNEGVLRARFADAEYFYQCRHGAHKLDGFDADLAR